ncbi:lipoyl(octanoyl) transferase LipB [Thiomicrorhabdus indica]|uniref:lipoyl(octanoyl) transferase LipB n=1 Tax=Thiomicrorhabdus indica TaxID=2267253 RepID=UPI002AA80FA3|nr:lipoyl(octanoyl) transferase LipB [Thiomicrorhabdus indica]
MTDCIPIHIQSLGRVDYLNTWQAMQSFTEQRTPETPDELWIVEHPPVYTQGLNGKAEHLLNPNPKIPIVQTDRGGQITYHGPGQLVIYVLIDLKRRKLGVRALVSLIENSLIELLANLNIESTARADAPGVYVKGKKIASLGLKIRKQKSYHGLALNVDMDLAPFQAINPCGLQGMQMTQLKDEFKQLSDNPLPSFDKIGAQLTEIISAQLISS